MNFKNIQDYFEEKVLIFGNNAKGMDWKDEKSQHLRFEIIANYIDFNENTTILDVGCGNGEFFNYTKVQKKNVTYNGIDISNIMVDITNKRFGKNTAEISTVQDINKHKKYDYIISSGTFNACLDIKKNIWEVLFFESLNKMFQQTKKRVVVNFMSEIVDYKYKRLYYPKISKLSRYVCENLTRNFIIDHSYDLYEATIIIDK
jgi:cyclopropane fatty-acyl-phospholipid synthase-like methyltransferase